jgi:hypothetical protein
VSSDLGWAILAPQNEPFTVGDEPSSLGVQPKEDILEARIFRASAEIARRKTGHCTTYRSQPLGIAT